MKTSEAIAVHIQWKMTFGLKIALEEPLTQDHLFKIYNQNHCLLGLWLLSADTLPIRHTPQYASLNQHHTRFHREMARVAVLINASLYKEAANLLLPGSSFQLVSFDLANAITAAGRLLPG